GSPFCESTRAQLRELYSATNGLELSWTLLRANEEVRVNPSEVVGEVTLVGLEEVVDNAEYIERLGDMQNAEKDARIARMHPIDVNEEGYATVIDLDADDGSTLADVGNDGVDEKLGFGVREWVERLLLCRGFAGFGPISEGHHSGGKVLVAVIEGVFGEVDVGKRLPALSEPEEVDEVDEVSFTEQVRRCFATRKIPARVVAGLLTDASETYAIFGDSFANFEQLDAALAELFRASPVRHLGITIGNLSIIAQSSWDLGHYGSPSAYWSLLDEQLRGTSSPEEVAQRYTWIIDRTLDRYGGVRNPAKTRELATNFGDLATAINPQADPELRELAWLSMSEWRSAPELIAEAKKNLKSKGAGEVVAAIEALASAA
ncbi:MAG: hypothetical protein ACPG4T_23460, partial [Nannocystaceae bacterium]